MGGPRARRDARPAQASRRPDPHDLYRLAVQCPEADIRFIDRIYVKRNQRQPRRLREDFCGTAFLAEEWVRHDPENSAVGVDIDAPTLAWARRHVLHDLAARRRLRLIRGDASTVRTPPVDVTAALNFSYYCLKERQQLLRYMRRARAGLRPGGLLLLDAFAGSDAGAVLRETTRKRGFTYVWEQRDFDPVTHDLHCLIHFRLPDGVELRRAFSYHWRLWTLPEIRDCLADAGFAGVEVYIEATDAHGRGNGIFRRSRRAQPCEGLIAYVAAWR